MNRNTILASKIRPTVRFDVTNQEHRYWAYQFVTTMSWRDCPYVFSLPHTESNVYSMMCRSLAEYYSHKEFAVAEKPLPEKVVPMKLDKKMG